MGRLLEALTVTTPFTLIASINGSCKLIHAPFAEGLHWQSKYSKLELFYYVDCQFDSKLVKYILSILCNEMGCLKYYDRHVFSM